MKGKRLFSLILVLVLMFSTAITASASNSTLITRTQVSSDEVQITDFSTAITGVNTKLTVKRQDDTFIAYNLVTVTKNGINVDVEWVEAVQDFIDNNATDFPAATYGSPSALGYVTSTATAAQKQTKHENIIKLLKAIKADATTMAALKASNLAFELKSSKILNDSNEFDISKLHSSGAAVDLYDDPAAAAGQNIILKAEPITLQDNTYKWDTLTYSFEGLKCGLYFIDAKNTLRSSGAGYEPVLVDLVPSQTGPSGNWYIKKAITASLKYEDIKIDKQINGKKTDIVGNGELVTFKIEIEVPRYKIETANSIYYDKDDDTQSKALYKTVYKNGTFAAFDDMSQGFTLIPGSARLEFRDEENDPYHPEATLTAIGSGSYKAVDATEGTYEAYLIQKTIPFYSTTTNEVYFYAQPNDTGVTATIWAVQSGVLTAVKNNFTIGTKENDVITYEISDVKLDELNQVLVNKLPSADLTSTSNTNIKPVTYTDSNGNSVIQYKSLIGAKFNYAKLMDAETYRTAATQEARNASDFSIPNKLVISYDASVNESFMVASEANTNTAYAYYVKDDAGSIGEVKDTVKAWSYGLNLVKVDGNNYDKYSATTDETQKAALKADTNHKIWLSGATFNAYKKDTIYCGGESATSAPASSNYSSFTFYGSADEEAYASETASGTVTDADTRYTNAYGAHVRVNSDDGKYGLYPKSIIYDIIQKSGISDPLKVRATVAAAVAEYKASGGYKTLDKFVNKYDYSMIYKDLKESASLFTDTDATTQKTKVAVSTYALNLATEKTTKKINPLTDYVIPNIYSASDTVNYSTTAALNTTSKKDKFVIYIPVEVNSCDYCNKKHYHVECYTLFWRNITSTDAENGINLNGFDTNRYLLVETAAPTGYNEVDTALQFDIKKLSTEPSDGSYKYFESDPDTDNNNAVYGGESTNGRYPITVKNYQGVTLPSTGGMGTLLFTIIGIILMILAIIFVIMKNRKLAKNAAAFMCMAIMIVATVAATSLTAQAVTTINLGGSTDSTSSSTKVTSAGDIIKMTVKLNDPNDHIEVYKLTNKLTMGTNGIMSDLTWTDAVKASMSGFETEYGDGKLGYEWPQSPDLYAKSNNPDLQSKFLNYIYDDRHNNGLDQAVWKDDVTGTYISYTTVNGVRYAVVTDTATNSPVSYGIYLIKGYNTVTNKSYQVLTCNAVPTQPGPLSGYYISDSALNVTLKYADLYIKKQINDKAYDNVRYGEVVNFKITGEVPTYLPINSKGTVLTASDGDEFTNYDYSVYKFVITDQMSDAFSFSASDISNVKVYFQTNTINSDTTLAADSNKFSSDTVSNKAAILASQVEGQTPIKTGVLDGEFYKFLYAPKYDNTEKVGLLTYKDATDTRYQLWGNVTKNATDTSKRDITWYKYDTNSQEFVQISTSSSLATSGVDSAYTNVKTVFETSVADYRTAQGYASTTTLTSNGTKEFFGVSFDYKKLRDCGIKAVQIRFPATVTTKCETGVDTNTNTASAWYRKDVSGNYDKSDSVVRAYTFGLQLLKSDGDKGTWLSNAKFSFYKEAYIFVPDATNNYTGNPKDNWAKFTFKKGADNDEFSATANIYKAETTTNYTLAELNETVGEYYFRYVAVTATSGTGKCSLDNLEANHYHVHVYKKIKPTAAITAKDSTNNSVEVFSTGGVITTVDTETGVIIKGLEPASYVLIEDAPPSTAYNILTEAMRFEIKALSETDLDRSENNNVTNASNRALALAGFVSTNKVTNTATATDYFYTGEKEADGTTKIYYQAYPNGIYKINVKNYQGVQLPSTGGMGTLLFTVIGILMMLIAMIVVLAKNKRTAEYQ